MTVLSLTFPINCQVTPPRCRIARSGEVTHVARVTINEVTDASAPILAVVILMESGDEGAPTIYRVHDGRVLMPVDLRDHSHCVPPPVTLAEYVTIRVLKKRQYGLTEEQARTHADESLQEITRSLVMVDGVPYIETVEPAWSRETRFSRCWTVTPIPGERDDVYRLDEYAEVVRESAKRDLFPIRAMVTLYRPDLLTRKTRKEQIAQKRVAAVIEQSLSSEVSDLRTSIRAVINTFENGIYPPDVTVPRFQALLAELEWISRLRIAG